MFFPSVHNIYLISQEYCSRFVVEWRGGWVTGSIYLFQRFKKALGLPLSARSWTASAFSFHQSSFICLREGWTFLLHSLNFAVLERRPVWSISFLTTVLSCRRDWMDSLFLSNQSALRGGGGSRFYNITSWVAALMDCHCSLIEVSLDWSREFSLDACASWNFVCTS